AWTGAAAVNGLSAARLARAGVVRNAGTAALSLGSLLGTFEPGALTEGLDVPGAAGEAPGAAGPHGPPAPGRGGAADWQITHNYFKRHASCSYTHPAADLAIEARAGHLRGLAPAEIAAAVGSLTVDTHRLAAPLDRTHWDNGLGAMFSVPYAVAAALLDGEVAPATADASERRRPELFALARRVTVREDPALTARLPHERPARLTVRFTDGREPVALSAPHPVGDSAHRPFTDATLSAFLTRLLGGAGPVERLRGLAGDLQEAEDVGPLLRGLAGSRDDAHGHGDGRGHGDGHGRGGAAVASAASGGTA
ncbi:MmgE/PrpD family protein, partial [Streptomyces fuscigenes]|nr:MmgE/PrpD family protein [Streptomyces fuscigenes]